jgi:hypothetical protein
VNLARTIRLAALAGGIVLVLASAGAGAAGPSSKTFSDAAKTFSFSYPAFVSVSNGSAVSPNDWSHGATVPGKVLAFGTIFPTFEPHTNFANATFSVGSSADPAALATCLQAQTGSGATKSAVTLGGVPFAKFRSNDAGAGNFYDLTSYRTIHHKTCYAIEYLIHSLNIGNFPTGSGIAAFDDAKVHGLLGAMAASFRFL